MLGLASDGAFWGCGLQGFRVYSVRFLRGFGVPGQSPWPLYRLGTATMTIVCLALSREWGNGSL